MKKEMLFLYFLQRLAGIPQENGHNLVKLQDPEVEPNPPYKMAPVSQGMHWPHTTHAPGDQHPSRAPVAGRQHPEARSDGRWQPTAAEPHCGGTLQAEGTH